MPIVTYWTFDFLQMSSEQWLYIVVALHSAHGWLHSTCKGHGQYAKASCAWLHSTCALQGTYAKA